MTDKRGFTSVVSWSYEDPEREFLGVTVEVDKNFEELDDKEQDEFGRQLAELSVESGLFLDPIIILRGIERAGVWWQTGDGGAYAIGEAEAVVKRFRNRLDELKKLST